MAADVDHKCSYVDDCLTGAADTNSALLLQQQLTELFSRGGFILRKCNSNDPVVLQEIPEELRDSREVQVFSDEYLEMFGIEWNFATNQFRIQLQITLQEVT